MSIKKLASFIFLALVASVVGAHSSIVAQVTPLPTTTSGGNPAAKPQAWVCLSSTKYDPTKDPQVTNATLPRRHIARASSTGFPDNKCVYIVGCIYTKDNIVCTTGQDSTDQELGLGDGNATKVRNGTGTGNAFEFKVDGGPKVCNPVGGTVDVKAFTESRYETVHSMFGVYFTDVDAATVEKSGTAQTLKYGSFGFKGDPSSCGGVRWDPFGVAFDAKSLEPIPGVSVTLNNDKGAKVVLAGLQNPMTTREDGFFNFLPEPGKYILNPVKSPYSLISSLDQVNQNYTKAYSQLYLPKEVIDEQSGKEEHRDVALDPGTTTPQRADPVHISYGVSQTGRSLRLGGKQSHPFTIVTFSQDGVELAKTTADHYGFYEVFVGNQLVSAASPIGVAFTKVDLTQAATAAAVAKKAYEVSPIPPYLEGKAYDKQGSILVNAKVRVKLDMNDKVVTETTTDQNGIFAIDPASLPVFTYRLEYTPANSFSVVKKTVVEFASENKEYLTQNNVNLMTASKNGHSLLSGGSTQESQPPTISATEAAAAPTSTSSTIIVILVFLFILLSTIVATIVYWKRHQPEEITQTPPSAGSTSNENQVS